MHLEEQKWTDPRHNIWLEIAQFLSDAYLSPKSNIDWKKLKQHIPSASQERVEKIFDKIKNSENLNKGERIFLIMLKLLNEPPVTNREEIIKQLQTHINTIEVIFVPWDIVVENQKRNNHEAETDPMKLADLYRTDSTQQAIKDAMAGVPPQERDQFYRGIMKPPSETASRRNIFPGKVIYGLTGHLITVDEKTGAIQIQQVGEPYQSTLTGLWFDKEYFKSMPNRTYVFQKPGDDSKNVWDDYTFNEQADITNKKS
ncbi:hypothetical protein [Crocosphaera chwakensis]|uniref:Uncharacterized protein n=1 Tax=Crocosphaera chwakensis CCY0110 TaxID=391612 RepID=A3IQ97_9CHRO|nr:hypothetical protein [Crocosphaera chwakensis]EAZ91437.1 hypothetical protein CY0110_05687 [Crocosphaera chwakensis CCY0110]